VTILSGSIDLLAAIPEVLDGVAVRVLAGDGQQTATFGAAADGAPELRMEFDGGSVVVAYPPSTEPRLEFLRCLLGMISERERLESDMESMSTSSLRLMERMYELVEALPQLSAGSDDIEIAKLGVRACQRAAGVQQVVYVSYSPVHECCEVVVHFDSDAGRRGTRIRERLDPVIPATSGFLCDVLQSQAGVVLRAVPPGARLGEQGSPEYLAREQILGLPVTFGSGDKRIVIGALLLLDKRTASYAREGAEPGPEERPEEAPIGNEEVQVAESFAAMLGAVLGARKTAELGKELTMARAIQQQILPADAIRLPGFDVAAEYRASGAVGGDYFDYVPLADGRTLVVIADVSGHNLASGMMMVSARAMLRTLASVRQGPAEVFEDLAATMFGDLTRTERFITAAGVALRGRERSIDYVSAGHNDLFVYRAVTDRVDRVASDSTVLGFVPKPGYAARTIVLSPGDCMLMFTDGITEATDETDEMFGDDRLAALLAQLAPGRSARAILDGVLQEVDSFRRGQMGTDDITAVAIRCVEAGGPR
jgi:serine phosphatase RsbU (regulator of sigma subunit)